MSYLTDKEKRLLFSALTREKKVCKQVDDECCREPYETSLESIVCGLERKFYYDRFERDIRNRAIDEFAKKIKEATYQWFRAGTITVGTIDEIAEQLKGIKNG